MMADECASRMGIGARDGMRAGEHTGARDEALEGTHAASRDGLRAGEQTGVRDEALDGTHAGSRAGESAVADAGMHVQVGAKTRAEQLVAFIHKHSRPITIMEVCGTHTAAIAQSGMRSLLPEEVRLVSGPGCPVCVTPAAYIDRLIDLAARPGGCALAFGDLLRVPGSRESLAQAQARGVAVRIVYSPMEAVRLAKAHPDTAYTLAAIGFEATTPLYALALDAIVRQDLRNLKLLTSLKTMIPAMDAICVQERIDGFLCPGHVSVCIGADAYEPLCARWRRPFVVAGFEPERILAAVAHILLQVERGVFSVENLYPGVVTRAGNVRAMEWTRRFFVPVDAVWRGLGSIPLSGLRIREEYAAYDAAYDPVCGENGPAWAEPGAIKTARAAPDGAPSAWATLGAEDADAGCRCGDVMLGRIEPRECPLFARECAPPHPVGACMVSREGACGIAWHVGGDRL